jgi:hypothetical protein
MLLQCTVCGGCIYHLLCFPALPQSPEALERNQLAWLAFGAGPRLCIGYKFALNEAKTVLVSLWQRYDFELDTARTPDPPLLRPGITLGYREGLWCKVLPRASAAATDAAAKATAGAAASDDAGAAGSDSHNDVVAVCSVSLTGPRSEKEEPKCA